MSSTPPRNDHQLWNEVTGHPWEHLMRLNLFAESSQTSLNTTPNLDAGSYHTAPTPNGRQMDIGVWNPNQALSRNTEVQNRAVCYSPGSNLTLPQYLAEPPPFLGFGFNRAQMQAVPNWPVAVHNPGRFFNEQPVVPRISPLSDWGTMSTALPSLPQSPDPEQEIRAAVFDSRPLPSDYICDCCGGDTPDGGKHIIYLCPLRNRNPDDLAVSPYQGNRVSQGSFRCSCGNAFESRRLFKDDKRKCWRCHKWLTPYKMFKLNASQYKSFH